MADPQAPRFAPRADREAVEEGLVLAPKFDADGLIPCIVTDAAGGDVLMFAFMNAEALARTLETGEAHYWSRSRKALWRKGEESGRTQRVSEMRIDCDQDALWIKVETAKDGANCHLGYRSCFFRAVPLKAAAAPADLTLERVEASPIFDPETVYRNS